MSIDKEFNSKAEMDEIHAELDRVSDNTLDEPKTYHMTVEVNKLYLLLAQYVKQKHLSKLEADLNMWRDIAIAEANNFAMYTLHSILSDDVDSELDHSDIEQKFATQLQSQRDKLRKANT